MDKDISMWTENLIKAQLENGKFADRINRNGESLVNAHVWGGILGLYSGYVDDYDKTSALEWLINNQNADGSFSVFVEDEEVAGSPDLTAMAVCAMSAAGLESSSDEITKAMAFVENWILNAESTRNGASTESISWWIMAKKFIGEDLLESDKSMLDAYRLEDGSYTHFKAGKRGSGMATYHALLATSDFESGTSWMKDLRYSKGLKTLGGSFF